MNEQERKAMELALYALNAYRPVIVKRKGLTYSLGDKAITAIKEALAVDKESLTTDAQPEQEPQIAFNAEVIGYVAPQRKPPQFPTMLRKMWFGGEVQQWINENWK